MKDYIGFVYLWICLIDGKKYIGLHEGSIEDGYIGSGLYFKRAVERHGIENFKRIILYYEYESVQNLYQKEFDIINLHNAVFSEEYYNLTNYSPKCAVKGKRKRIVTEETKEKIRKARKGSKASQETKDKMSKMRKGKPSPTKGMKGLTSGSVNGQYGKHWYNNGIEDGTFLPQDVPVGWVRGRIRGILRGKKNGFYGKKHTQETKDKISKTKKGIK